MKEIVQEDAKTVREFLNNFKEQTKPNLDPFKEVAEELHSLTWEYTSREWKGLRSSLVLRMTAAFGGDMQTALILAGVMQLEQDWILPHDDFEDKSELRRGKPTLHKIAGEDIAINVGDRMRSLSDKLFALALRRCLEKIRYQLLDFRIQTIDEVMQGQHFEMRMRKLPLSQISQPAVMLIYDRKTGTYTYEMPCGFGLFASNFDSAEILKMKPFFRMYGAAFQIQDDFLNLKATEESGYGKEFADDILEGKWTIFAERAANILKGVDLQRFFAIYGNRNASISERKELVKIFDENDVFNQGLEIQKDLWNKAKTGISEFIPKIELGEELIAVLDYGCNRTK